MSDQSLEGLLGFSDADLAGNRGGRLGPGQRARLVWSGLWRLVLGPALLIGALVIAIAAFTDSAFGTVIALLVAGFGLWLTWQGFAFIVDGVDRHVAFVTGPLDVEVVRGKTTSYYACVGPVRKSISRRTSEQLPDGLVCHLYYAPACRSLLSIEPATEGEPKPQHPFGPDSAHAWDRIRGAWVAVAIGVLGLALAAHSLAAAHTAQPHRIGGTVATYYVTHGSKGGVYRHLELNGDATDYQPQDGDSYTPPVVFENLIGKEIVLYVDRGTANVLAVNDGDQLHAGDWYLHPEHEWWNDLANALAVGLVGLAFLAGGIATMRQRQRRLRVTDPTFARTPLYAMPGIMPPSVRPWYANWTAVLAFTVVGGALGLLFALVTHR